MSDIYDLRELAEEMNKLREMKEKRISDQDRLEQLEALDAEFITVFADSMEDYADNVDPIMIANYYFEDYARQLAEDLGAISSVNSGLDQTNWPANHIDWEAAADQLKMDYTSVTFEGREYWIRG